MAANLDQTFTICAMSTGNTNNARDHTATEFEFFLDVGSIQSSTG
jgi:hypothetical protein